MTKYEVPRLDEIKKNRHALKNLTRKEVKISFSPLEKFAVLITRRVGSMGFFFILTIWTAGWFAWNTVAPLEYRFDAAPAFVLWLFISNMLQLILLPLVMVGQNLEGKFADKRAQEDFEVNMKAEREIEVIISHLENQAEVLEDLRRKMESR